MVWTSQLFLNSYMDILYGVSVISNIFMYNIFMPWNFRSQIYHYKYEENTSTVVSATKW